MPDNWIDKGESFHQETGFDKFLKWLKNNRDTAIGLLVVFAAVIILVSYFVMKYSQIKQSAWQELFKARQLAYMGKIDSSKKTIGKIEKAFAKTDAAVYALMLSGDIFYRQNRFEEAVKEYEKAKEKAGESEILPVIIYDIGKSQEAAKKFKDAEKTYEDFLSRYPEHFMAPEIHFSLARIYEMNGRMQKAKEAYEKISVLYPQTGWAQAAKGKLTPTRAKKNAGK